ncbi:WYL domain-containing protein [Isoptericola sp. NEAU-Y5]|uniref:WYL domain-containing protein n=1 Tax=Isoptericola luteus TaxID=2879484 RepID=A0ABS7ZBM1_9MICO|nr:WYL domain-containing protein [Isoptericola sp. NEAU-Y5]MCA5892425.1 WYL domain-containing protein [Isoptericola sp. NEAU-Y5]
MIETSARLLHLLSLLQLRRDWTSAELADRLGVSTRTVRADIARLRSLDYPVQARPGVSGGYRLAAGTAMPPLVLDDDEAVAVGVGLGVVATQGVGAGETSLTALAKLEQVLPTRLRRRVEAVREATSVVTAAGADLDLRVLSAVAAAVRAAERLRFGYTAHDGTESTRHVEPARVVRWGTRWYLLAWDLGRDDWRVFRVDRMVPRPPTGARFPRREIPEDSVVEHIVGSVRSASWRYRARILVHAPAADVVAKVGGPLAVEEVGPSACRVEVGSDDPDRLALWVAQLGADVEVLEGAELAAAFDRLAERFRRAAGATPPTPPPTSP